jgi:DNA mismatch repair protein MutL
MQHKISVLSDVVVNRIAAGEVIERPASVVKELFENAIDASATSISIHLANGGKSFIQVNDNGVGMSKHDLLLCCERHATSKISTEFDLVDLTTKGFRGEALASIAAVSHVKIESRRKTDSNGNCLIIEHGKLVSVSPIAMDIGTSISVTKLFHAVPVRKKFLRSDSLELLRSSRLVRGIILGEPQVSLKFLNNQQELLSLPSVDSSETRIKSILGSNALKINYISEQHGISVTGYILPPHDTARSSILREIDTLTVLINKRLVADRFISACVREAFGTMLKSHETPKAIILLSARPGLIDFNVHPQKTEVRFQKPYEFKHCIIEAISNALNTANLQIASHHLHIPQQSQFPIAQSSTKVAYVAPSIQSKAPVTARTENLAYKTDIFDLTYSAPQEVKETQSPVYPPQSDFTFIGLYYSCYILCQHKNELYLIDMHAAHERVNHNYFLEQSKQVPVQQLLVPIQLVFLPEELSILLEAKEVFYSLGIEFNLYQENSLQITSLPCFPLKSSKLTVPKLESLFKEYLEKESLEVLSKQREHLCARLACHASVRSGDQLDPTDAKILWDTLQEIDRGSMCPHGRPTSIKLSKQELEKLFKR